MGRLIEQAGSYSLGTEPLEGSLPEAPLCPSLAVCCTAWRAKTLERCRCPFLDLRFMIHGLGLGFGRGRVYVTALDAEAETQVVLDGGEGRDGGGPGR